MSSEEIIEMVGRARRVNLEVIGRRDKAIICDVRHIDVIAQAQEISDSGWIVEFGKTQSLQDVLYISVRAA